MKDQFLKESATTIAPDDESSNIFTMTAVFDDVLRAKRLITTFSFHHYIYSNISSDDVVLMKGASMSKVSVNIDDDTNDHRTQLYDQMLTEFTGIKRGVDFSSLFDDIDRCVLDVDNQIAAVDAQIRYCQ
jgi:hypothetical protein